MHNFRILTYSLVLAMAVCACSDDKKEYVPAQPESPDCLGVYFDENNEKDFIFVPGYEASVTLTLHRLNTAAEVDVPIIGKSSAEGISFPASAHFAAGSADSQIVIDCNGLPLSQKVTFSVNLPEEYINHYAATLYNYESSALMSAWEKANTDGSKVTFYFTSSDCSGSQGEIKSTVYQPVESEMYVMPGAGMIRVENFLNTGVDMTLRLTESPYEDYAGLYRVSPVDNYYTLAEAYESDAYGDGWYNPWFIYNDTDDDYVECALTTLDGEASVLDYPYMYWYSDSEMFEYSYARLKTTGKYHTVSMGITGTTDGSVTLPTYFYVFFRWDGNSPV